MSERQTFREQLEVVRDAADGALFAADLRKQDVRAMVVDQLKRELADLEELVGLEWIVAEPTLADCEEVGNG